MLGVVLWSDPREGKAVIWCEDHGELAFYRRVDEGHSTGPEFDPGDLVQFDVETVRHLRFALNPQVVKGGLYRDLPQGVGRAETEYFTQGRRRSAGKARGRGHPALSGCPGRPKKRA